MPAIGLIRNKQVLDKFMVRIPRTLKAQVTQSARVNRRSINAEVLFRLEQSIERDNVSDDTGTLQEVDQSDLSSFEIRLINFYRRLSRDKRLALLALFAN